MFKANLYDPLEAARLQEVGCRVYMLAWPYDNCVQRMYIKIGLPSERRF
ncbi:MAG: hypothetical protein PWP65_747 [Clostridia bacterium]|nr:hypothetical protein [Clostridia bacterium]